MAEYWKSLPRKFCDVCKCWFADNKASIDFHERGKRHKENAQKRIHDIQKRGIKDFKKQQELENEMEKIEKAALAAYEKDLKNMQSGDTQSSLQSSKRAELAYEKDLKNRQRAETQSNSQPSKKFSSNFNKSFKKGQKKQHISARSSKQPEIETSPQKVWYEAMSEDGYKYYWNSVTSESSWEPPEEGFISIEEQNPTNSETVSEEEQKEQSLENTETPIEETEESSHSESDSETETKSETAENTDVSSSVDVQLKADTNVSCSIGPQPKVDPYGQWVTIEKEEPVEYDLQLPVPSENTVEVLIPIHKDGPSLKFKEKVIGQLTDTEPGEVTFKKRKNAGSFRRNARQRFTDDD